MIDIVVHEFVAESYENLDRLVLDVVALERNPGDPDTLASIFRALHTIKGTCGFLGFTNIETLAHAGESLLALVRDGKRDMTPEMTTLLLTAADELREMLAQIEVDGHEGDTDAGGLIARLTALGDPTMGDPGDVVSGGSLEPNVIAQSQQNDPPRGGAATAAPMLGRTESSVRVDMALLDSLANLVGELVLAKNQLLRQNQAQSDRALRATSQQISLVTSQLQSHVMRTRLQPIGAVLASLPRSVRDLARAAEKEVHFEIEGQETELDRTFVEAVKDPITHLIRNAIDHGIERPLERLASGKPTEGRLALRAFHQNGHIAIEVTDDGGGIDLDRVRQRAIADGLVDSEAALAMSDQEASSLVFLPGLSTAEAVTNLSGRGVGLDVVKANVDRIGGTVEVRTELGQGTTFRITMPLTLAVLPALIVTSGDERYAIPQASLLELIDLDAEHRTDAVGLAGDNSTCSVRGETLPLVTLGSLLDGGHAGDSRPPLDPEHCVIVVLESNGQAFALAVDGALDIEEIVVKPLGRRFKDLDVFAGATILGDGRVSLILNVSSLAPWAAALPHAPSNRSLAGHARAEPEEARQSLLVLRVGQGQRAALPLDMVLRLEELPSDVASGPGPVEIVAYPNAGLPLVHLSDVLGVAAVPPTTDLVPVVVTASTAGPIGLVVDELIDIVEAELPPTNADGIADTKLLDVEMIEAQITAEQRSGLEMTSAP